MDGISTIWPEKQEHCDKHGEYTSKNFLGEIWSKCPKCANEAAEQETIDREIKEKEEKLESWKNKIGGSGIPKRFQDRKFSSYIAETDGQKKALNDSKLYAKNFEENLKNGKCLIFCGNAGTGKTHLSCAIAKDIMFNLHKKVLFMTCHRAINSIKHASFEDKSANTEKLTSCDLLILDELGISSGSIADDLILFDLINRRYEDEKPTILLSNLDPIELKNFLGVTIWDRLKEGGGELISFNWESKRASI